MLKKTLLILLILTQQLQATAELPSKPNKIYIASQLTFFTATFAFGCYQVANLAARAMRYRQVDYLGEYENELIEKEIKAAFTQAAQT